MAQDHEIKKYLHFSAPLQAQNGQLPLPARHSWWMRNAKTKLQAARGFCGRLRTVADTRSRVTRTRVNPQTPKCKTRTLRYEFGKKSEPKSLQLAVSAISRGFDAWFSLLVIWFCGHRSVHPNLQTKRTKRTKRGKKGKYIHVHTYTCEKRVSHPWWDLHLVPQSPAEVTSAAIVLFETC